MSCPCYYPPVLHLFHAVIGLTKPVDLKSLVGLSPVILTWSHVTTLLCCICF